MKIIDYFMSQNPQYWIEEIKKCDWSAALILSKQLKDNAFHQTLGNGTLYLLIEGNFLIGFGTLTQKDCIKDDNLYPWIGYLFIQPYYRGHRYSQSLIKQMLMDAIKQGYNRVYLATEHIGLYEKYGFIYVENRIDIWGDINRIYFIDLTQYA